MTTTAEPTAAPLALDGYDLIVVGRRKDRLTAVAASLTGVITEVLVADLATDTGIDSVAEICATRPLTMLVNNAGVAHYIPMADLPADKARELLQVKVLAPAMLTRAALPGMLTRSAGTIINVAGTLAFAGPAPAAPPSGQRATYVGTLAATVAMTQTLHTELAGTGVSAHVVCPGIVATEFHEVQGMNLSAVPRMSAADVPVVRPVSAQSGDGALFQGTVDFRSCSEYDESMTIGYLPTATRRSSDLSKHAAEVFSEAEDHPVTVTRRDGESLVLMSQREAEGRARLLNFAAQLITVTLEDSGTLAERMSKSFPWMLALSPADRATCAHELVDAARASFATDQPHLAIAELVSWKETAVAIAAGLRSVDVVWLEDGDAVERP